MALYPFYLFSYFFKILFQKLFRTEGPNLHDILEKHVTPGWGSGNSLLLGQHPAVMGHKKQAVLSKLNPWSEHLARGQERAHEGNLDSAHW